MISPSLTYLVTYAIFKNTHTHKQHDLKCLGPWRVKGFSGNSDAALLCGWHAAAAAPESQRRLTQWKEVVCFHRRLKNKVV